MRSWWIWEKLRAGMKADARTKAGAGEWTPPPREDWDFRGIVPEECDVACYWEYARELPKYSKDPKSWVHDASKSQETLIHMCSDGKHLETPWLSLTPREREVASNSRMKARPLMVRTVRDLAESWLRLSDGDPGKAFESIRTSSSRAYVVYPEFERYGAERVIAEFKAWARKESKRVPRRLQGKAAEPPFKYLKWLSAYRLEQARRGSRLSFEGVQEFLRGHQRTHPVDNPADVLPKYASHGAWCKAIGDAERLLRMDEADRFALAMMLLEPARWKLEDYPEAAKRLAKAGGQP